LEDGFHADGSHLREIKIFETAPVQCNANGFLRGADFLAAFDRISNLRLQIPE
jgi:hypothetical protein